MPFYTDFRQEPKRSFRFLFELVGTAGGVIGSYAVKDVKKPTLQMEAGPQVKYIQHTFKYPGRVMWQDVNATIFDLGGEEDSAQILYNMFARSGYAVPKDFPGVGFTNESVSKAKSVEAIGTPRLRQIDDKGGTVEEWTLHNCYLANVDFGQVSYDTDEMVNIAMTLTYDYATLRQTGVAASPRILP